jgi:hypothetical protein
VGGRFRRIDLLRDVRIAEGNAAYLFLARVILIDAWLLYRSFAARARFEVPQATSVDLKAEEPPPFCADDRRIRRVAIGHRATIRAEAVPSLGT